MKEKLFSPVNDTVILSGGWGPWITPKPTAHNAYDITGIGQNIYSCLSGVICNPSEIYVYRTQKYLDKQGFALRCDSGEYVHYQHCMSLFPIGTRVEKGKKIGYMDTIAHQKSVGANLTGVHLHWALITDKGKTFINPLFFLDRNTKLGGQYDKRQYTMPDGSPMPDQYIFTKDSGPTPEEKEELMYKEKYNTLVTEYENYKATMASKLTELEGRLLNAETNVKQLEGDLSAKTEALFLAEIRIRELEGIIVERDKKIENQAKEITKFLNKKSFVSKVFNLIFKKIK